MPRINRGLDDAMRLPVGRWHGNLYGYGSIRGAGVAAGVIGKTKRSLGVFGEVHGGARWEAGGRMSPDIGFRVGLRKSW